MYAANGVGLAAPQIGLSIRLFIVDCSSFKELDSKAANFKKIFINPKIIFEVFLRAGLIPNHTPSTPK